jgi:hypothetical protein
LIKVTVTSGAGAWTAVAEVELVACPHVGDYIEVHGLTVVCDSVYITGKGVIVHEKRRFASEEEATRYFPPLR